MNRRRFNNPGQAQAVQIGASGTIPTPATARPVFNRSPNLAPGVTAPSRGVALTDVGAVPIDGSMVAAPDESAGMPARLTPPPRGVKLR